jgi:putative FmdB family regulatory protein
MPIYEYVCKDCGYQFEKIRSMKDADQPIHCKNCLGEHTHRAISVFYAKSDGGSITSGGGCGSCGGGSCGSCGHQH